MLFSKMCFMFLALAFNDVMTFEYLKKKKSFQSEIKNIFLVSKVLFLRHTNQTSKNVPDTTFNTTCFSINF